MFRTVILGAAHQHVFKIAQFAQACGEASLVGVYDEDPEVLQAAAERLAIPAISTVEKALASGPQIVLIGAVPCRRAELAQKAVARGAAVLVDKPTVVTHESLQKLMAAVERYKKPVITYFPYRGEPYVRAAKAALERGRVGKLVQVAYSGPLSMKAQRRPAWHWTRADNGGILIDIGSHGMDLCCWIAGQDPVWISAVHHNFTQPQHPEFQDFAQAQIRFGQGQFAHVQVDWLAGTGSQTRVSIQGTEGRIELGLGREGFGRICTSKPAAEELDISSLPPVDQWASQLIEDMALGRPCAIKQKDVWRACRASLCAFDSAQLQGSPVSPPPVTTAEKR